MKIEIQAQSRDGEDLIMDYFKSLFYEQSDMIPIQIGKLKLECHFGNNFNELIENRHNRSIQFVLKNSRWELPDDSCTSR